MTLYFVRHEHDAETCPAKDPEMGSMLLNHISAQNALKHGVNLHGDAVLDGQHTFVLIVDAASEENVRNFMLPFSQAGPVEITQASSCEVVVERAGC